MAVIKDKTTGVYRLQFTEWTGQRRTLTMPKTATKKDADRLFAKLSLEHSEIKRGIRPPPSIATKKHFTVALAEYLAWGNTQGGRGGRPWSAIHSATRKTFLEFWRDRLKLVVLADLIGSLPKIEAVLQDIQKAGPRERKTTRKLTGKTLNEYMAALTAFCRWCDERDYFDKFPLKGLQKFHAAPQTVRRALTADEIRGLLAVCAPRRALIYSVAIFTGLRCGELQALTAADFDATNGGIILRAEWTKNRKEGFQPLPGQIVAELMKLTTGAAPWTRIFAENMHNAARWIEADLNRAGIMKWAPGGKVDFHSLRVTFATLVCGSGATLKESMDLVRHVDPKLTMQTYARASGGRLADIVEQIGAAILPAGEKQNQKESEG